MELSIPTPTAYPIPVTCAELASACEAMRYMASDILSTEYALHRRNEASALRGLAYALEERHRTAIIEAGRVEMVGEEE